MKRKCYVKVLITKVMVIISNNNVKVGFWGHFLCTRLCWSLTYTLILLTHEAQASS